MRVLLIVPAYNEEANIERVVQTIVDYAAQETAYQLDYIIINDGSTDNTAAICRERGFHTIHLVQNLGIGGAVQTGYLLANRKGYDAAVQFDGDGQHDIHSLSALLEPIMRDECDFVIGSRFLGTGEFRSTQMRRVGIRFLTGMIRLCSGCRLTDPTSGFRAANRRAIAFLSNRYPVDYPEPESIISLSKCMFRIQEAPVNMFERSRGTSSISPWKSVYYMFKVSLAILCTGFQRKRRVS